MLISSFLFALSIPSFLRAYEFEGQEIVYRNDQRKIFIYLLSDRDRVMQFNVGKSHCFPGNIISRVIIYISRWPHEIWEDSISLSSINRTLKNVLFVKMSDNRTEK